MKTLAIVYSFTGNNEKLAALLQNRIGCEVVKLETAKRRNGFSVFLDIMLNRMPALKPIGRDMRNYDHIIFLSPIWAGRIAMPLNSFLKSNLKAIANYSFITVCGGGNLSQKDKIVQQLATTVGHAPITVLELWTKKIMDFRKDSGSTATTVRVENDDFKMFSQEIEKFIEVLGVYDESPVA